MDELFEKVDKGIDLNEKELGWFVDEADIVDEIEWGEGTWREQIETIVNHEDKFYSVMWERGLTEDTESEYPNQPKEVKKHTYEKMVTFTEWVKL